MYRIQMYRVLWVGVVSLLTGVGWLAALLRLPTDAIVSSLVVATLFSITIAVWHSTNKPRPRAGRPSAAIAFGACGGAGLVGAVGAVTVLGFGAVVLIGLGLAASSPWVIRQLSSHWQWLRHSAIEMGPSLHPASRVGTMTDLELCRGWQISHELMQSSDCVRQRARLATYRQSYLDELERRHPAEFTCWLYNDATPANDPGRYLNSTE